MIRLLYNTDVYYLKEVVAIFRLHKNSKTVNEKFLWVDEYETVLKRYWDLIPNQEKKQIEANLELVRAANHLGVKLWDRKFAQIKLKNSIKIYPKIILSMNYFHFLFRSILPLGLLKFVRKSLIKLNLFFPHE